MPLQPATVTHMGLRRESIVAAGILGLAFLLDACTHNEEIVTGPPASENTPVIVRTQVSYTISVEANRFDYDHAEAIWYTAPSFLLTLSVDGVVSGAGSVSITDSGGAVVWSDTFRTNQVVVNQRMGAPMPIRVSVSLRNFTGTFSLAVVFGNSAADIMPLAAGNQWAYRSTAYGAAVAETVFYDITQQIPLVFRGNAVQAWGMRMYFKHMGTSPALWLRWKGADGVYDMGGISPTHTMLTGDLLLKYPAMPGDTWQVQNVVYSPYDSLFRIQDTLTYSLDTSGVLLRTPAGLFSCYVYKYSQKPADDVLEPWDYYWYYSPGVGLVGGNVRGHLGGDIKGQFDLLSYHVQ